MAFLSSLTPFSTWELGHNKPRHGFTNPRGKDYFFAPLTKAECDALARWRRALERVYRHPLGPGVCYAVEVWWRRLWFPKLGAAETCHLRFFDDSLATAIFLAAQLAIVLAAAAWTGQDRFVVVLPQAVWNALMGCAA